MELDPPLPATRSVPLLFTVVQFPHRFPAVAVLAHESFHVVSGMYPNADAGTGGVVDVFAVVQKVAWLLASSKSVPPSARLNGVDANPLTASPCVAAFWFAGAGAGSQPAEPLSPAEITTVMPSAAACCHNEL